ncbi:hypothetical protein [Biomaibacter acetigenes]|uniref:hypothetical protein n=1 Tax=Biomaibacter acetigenes TaxID=2316383 RepID=UPI001FE9AC15|nr:hypothetical protein [Biomaibacter acetigenes]
MSWAWLKFIVNVLTNEAVMEPLIAVILGYGVNAYAKNRRYRIIMDLTADIVDYIEEHYKEWGIKGSAKMDKFMDIFVQEYKKQMGRKTKRNRAGDRPNTGRGPGATRSPLGAHKTGKIINLNRELVPVLN